MVKQETWNGSEAKKLLFDDIISGDVYYTQCVKEIYIPWPEYAKFKYKNFVTTLQNLQVAITSGQRSCQDYYERFQARYDS